jgi:hypothetical protein
MYVRNYLGEIVEVDVDQYPDERQLYVALWKIKYNINLLEQLPPFNEQIIDYINGS